MPGGLLDMFGIDPVANRQARSREAELERQMTNEIMRQKLANQGQLDVQEAQNRGQKEIKEQEGKNARKSEKRKHKNEMSLEQWKALRDWAKDNNVAPDVVDALKPDREALGRTTMDTKKTDAEVARVQAQKRGALYGVRPSPEGLNPTIEEGLYRSYAAEAVNPANKAAKENALPITQPHIRQDPSNPLSFGVTPYLGEDSQEGGFDLKTGQMIPGMKSTAIRPGMPLITPADVARAEAEERAAAVTGRVANPGSPLFGIGPGALTSLNQPARAPAALPPAGVAQVAPPGDPKKLAEEFIRRYLQQQPNQPVQQQPAQPALWPSPYSSPMPRTY